TFTVAIEADWNETFTVACWLWAARNLVFRLLHIRTRQLGLSPDYHLRREQVVQFEQPEILILAIGHLAQSEGIAETLCAPRIHAHFDADDFHARNGLLLLQCAQQVP